MNMTAPRDISRPAAEVFDFFADAGSRPCSSPTTRARSDPGNHQIQGNENRDEHHQGVDHPPNPNRLDRNHENCGYSQAEAEQNHQRGAQCWLATCHAKVRS